ncbi:MAG: hypothetical protein PWR03_80 [Tenuifilum sp.]|uniref:hypothetical protein n=1 Tax=Tenuifilum sp. TaxID=2760880 RepID=UPI0024AC7887|nr:hypothetical protein [Tenuifilum sp.]MDI3525897.1 hypothetical protein [Tenuifilum sp.]
MLRLIFLNLILLSYLPLFGQLPEAPVSGSGSAMGNTWISLRSNEASLLNPAALGYSRLYWVGVHHENRFLLKELGESSIGVTIPVTPGSFGISLSHFGYNAFSRIKAGVGYGMHLGKRFVAGVGLSFTRLQIIGEYRNDNAYLIEGGIHYLPTDKLVVGFYLFNPTHSKFDNLADIPVLMGVGLTYLISDRIQLVSQLDDDTQREPAFRFGMEYFTSKGIAFRIGYSTVSPEGITVGVGLPVKTFHVDFGLSHNQYLGFTPKLSISYLFTKKS